MKVLFWTCLLGVVYAYIGYPLVLALLRRARSLFASNITIPPGFDHYPAVSLIIPAHNEAKVMGKKLENTLSLEYPGELQIVVVSDGSTDGTAGIVNAHIDDNKLTFLDLPERKGKANALNRAMEVARGEVLVFSDASIILDGQALEKIVRPFADPGIGCVSGEDRIQGGGGESAYGQYELFLRRQESALCSIVGASGSFYAQRKTLASEFPEGVAPDFLSVLLTVKAGYRAVSTPDAIGYMTAVEDSKNELRRKTRTVIRGLAALFSEKSLLKPTENACFSFFLISHKLLRWLVPFLLIGMLSGSFFLRENVVYLILFIGQVAFYLCALLAHLDDRLAAVSRVIRISMFFTVANLAILIAWFHFGRGVRQEIWTPSKRSP